MYVAWVRRGQATYHSFQLGSYGSTYPPSLPGHIRRHHVVHRFPLTPSPSSLPSLIGPGVATRSKLGPLMGFVVFIWSIMVYNPIVC